MIRALCLLGLILAGCATGEAVDPTCPRSCVLGERQCGQEIAVVVCVEGPDGCPEWSEPVVCPDESACLDGACQLGCRHACAPDEVGCANGGLQRCVESGDGCRAWSDPEACPDGETCDEGQCVSAGCADRCALGTTECVADGLRTCEATEACTDWSAPSPCPDDQACVDDACVVRCTDDCVPNARRCEADGFAQCVPGGDGCLRWSPVEACGAAERCDDGACVPEATECTDGCADDGALICEGDGFRRCGQYDPDPCLELSDLVACAELQVCRDGACVASCEDECVADAARCRGDQPETCGNFDADPCLEWGAAAACDAEERCDDGACVPRVDPCADVCPENAVRCVPGGVQRCVDEDDDPCLEWGAPQPCPMGESCRGAGTCEPDCADTCVDGERRCVGNGVATCANHDADVCLEFGTPSMCPAGQVCSDGQCRLDCVDECAPGMTACGPDGERRCGDFDADDCQDWSSPVPCGPGEGCVDAVCAPVCQDACNAGERRCDGVRIATCVDTDGDGCVEWGDATPCPAGEHCFDDVCIAAPEDDVHINEILYDGPGQDAPAVFIELLGPPGLSLDDVRLIGINGANGQPYGEIALMGALPADGLLVIAHPDAAGPLRAVVDVFDAGADLQNGPDNLILARGAAFIDQVAYGQFGGSDTFVGRGAPAAEPAEGQSLQRVGDVDDNRADWTPADPTPGALGCVDDCAEGAARCLDDLVQRCVAHITGCLRWAAIEACDPVNAPCQDGACTPAR